MCSILAMDWCYSLGQPIGGRTGRLGAAMLVGNEFNQIILGLNTPTMDCLKEVDYNLEALAARLEVLNDQRGDQDLGKVICRLFPCVHLNARVCA
jgi:hypothetical protein